MQHQWLYSASLYGIYDQFLQSDHEYQVWAEVLTMEEQVVAKVDILDGQVNIHVNTEGPDRSASVTLSDPENALGFGNEYAEDDYGVLWINRLVRLHHYVEVPGIGGVDSIVFVGVPTSVAKTGAEVALEMADKSYLSDHGVRPRSYGAGWNVRDTLLWLLMQEGETRFRIPTTVSCLSVPYNTGMGDDILTPWQLAKEIARVEAGWSLSYSADGYVTAEPLNVARPYMVMDHILSMPASTMDFTTFANYAKVTSNYSYEVTIKTDKGDKKTKVYDVALVGTAVLPPEHRLSEQALARNGYPRTIPVSVSDDTLLGSDQVSARAGLELAAASAIFNEPSFEFIPAFHLDNRDLIHVPQLGLWLPFTAASIPLGTGGNMTVGSVRWVSAPSAGNVNVVRTRKRRKKKKKGGGTPDGWAETRGWA